VLPLTNCHKAHYEKYLEVPAKQIQNVMPLEPGTATKTGKEQYSGSPRSAPDPDEYLPQAAG